MTLAQAEKVLFKSFKETNISKANKLGSEAAGLFYENYLSKHPKAKQAELGAAYQKWYTAKEKKFFK